MISCFLFWLAVRLAKHHISLEKFVIDHDAEVHGRRLPRAQLHGRSSIHELERLAHLRIDNPFQSVFDFHAHLDSLDLLNVDRLRPHWDTYFMVRARRFHSSSFTISPHSLPPPSSPDLGPLFRCQEERLKTSLILRFHVKPPN